MKRHIPALDGIRGIAILLVMATHLLPYRAASSVAGRVVNGFAGAGWTGVNLFFVLSGFLITGILYDTKATAHFFRNFYMRRTLRIMPLYFLVVALCLVVLPRLQPAWDSAPLRDHWMYWAYLSNVHESFRGGVPGGWLGPLWSLAVEEHFYLVWPAVIFFLARRSAIGVCLGCLVLANVSRVWFVLHGNLLAPYAFTLCRVDDLALGSLVALLLRDVEVQQHVARLRTAATGCAVFAGAATAALCVWRHGVILDPVMQVAGLPAVGVLAASVVTLAVLPAGARAWKAVLDTRFLRTFGKYSYGLYMLHTGVAALMHYYGLLLPRTSRLNDALNLCMMIAVSFAAALLSFHLYESPFLRLKRFFEPAGRRQQPHIEAQAGAPVIQRA